VTPLLLQSGGFEGLVSLKEEAHANDFAAPQRPHGARTMLNGDGITGGPGLHAGEADDLIARIDELLRLDVVARPRFEPVAPTRAGLGRRWVAWNRMPAV
jgi:hypothetical protein